MTSRRSTSSNALPCAPSLASPSSIASRPLWSASSLQLTRLTQQLALRREQFSHAFSASDGPPTGVMVAAPSADDFVQQIHRHDHDGKWQKSDQTSPSPACKGRNEGLLLKQSVRPGGGAGPVPAPLSVRSFARHAEHLSPTPSAAAALRVPCTPPVRQTPRGRPIPIDEPTTPRRPQAARHATHTPSRTTSSTHDTQSSHAPPGSLALRSKPLTVVAG